MAYVIERQRKGGTRFTGLYKAADGRYRSAGTYDTADEAQRVADDTEAHEREQLTGTSPADRATILLREFAPKFLREQIVEPKTKQEYARSLKSHILPYIGHCRVSEVTREMVHRLLAVVLKDAGVRRSAILHARTCLSALMQMAWDHGYRTDNPVRGIRLKAPPRKPVIVASKDQFLRVHEALPNDTAKLFARLGVACGARFCEMISFVPEDFDFSKHMLSISKSTVEVSAEFHPDGGRFVTRDYTKNGERRRLKIDAEVSAKVRDHVNKHGIGPGQLIFPVRLFVTTAALRRERLSEEDIDAAGWTEPLPNGRRYKHGTMGAYVTGKCRCEACKQWSADYGRDRKRAKAGRSGREWSPSRRRSAEEYLGEKTWRKIWGKAVECAELPFEYTPYQVRHTHASWLIDQGVDLERVRARLGHGDLTTMTRYVKILDEEDSVAADVIGSMFGPAA
jgi:integrase